MGTEQKFLTTLAGASLLVSALGGTAQAITV